MVTLYRLGHPAVVRQVTLHLFDELAVAVLTVEEQLTGWYTRLHRAKQRDELARIYQHLPDTIEFLAQFKILSFTEPAIERYERLKAAKLNVGKNDLRIAAVALEHGGTETEAIAALLHDAVEHAGGPRTRERVARDFGEEVAAIVDGCTDDAPDEGQVKRPWAERKREYIAHVADASASVLLVSAADKLHNLTTLERDLRRDGPSTLARFKAPDRMLWYYTEVISALRSLLPSAVLSELERAVELFAAASLPGDPAQR